MMIKPIIGPITTLAKDETRALLKENTLSLVNAIPKDISIKKIVAYVISIVVFTRKLGGLISKYKKNTETIIA